MNNTKRKTTAAACFSWRKLGQQQHTCLHVTRHAALLCVVLCLVVCCLPCCQCDSMCSKETQATDWIGQPKNGQHFLERNFIGVSANYPILPPKLRHCFVETLSVLLSVLGHSCCVLLSVAGYVDGEQVVTRCCDKPAPLRRLLHTPATCSPHVAQHPNGVNLTTHPRLHIQTAQGVCVFVFVRVCVCVGEE